MGKRGMEGGWEKERLEGKQRDTKREREKWKGILLLRSDFVDENEYLS